MPAPVNSNVMHISAMKYLVLLTTLLLVVGSSFAEIYRWVDEEGQVHFSDQKPDNENFKEVQIEDKVGSYQDISYSTYKPEATKTSSKNEVVMLSASWCGYCKKAETYFKKNKVRYTSYDIEKSSKGKRLPKDLHRVGVHNLAFEAFRELDCDRGFSGAGRTRHHDDRRKIRRKRRWI